MTYSTHNTHTNYLHIICTLHTHTQNFIIQVLKQQKVTFHTHLHMQHTHPTHTHNSKHTPHTLRVGHACLFQISVLQPKLLPSSFPLLTISDYLSPFSLSSFCLSLSFHPFFLPSHLSFSPSLHSSLSLVPVCLSVPQ